MPISRKNSASNLINSTTNQNESKIDTLSSSSNEVAAASASSRSWTILKEMQCWLVGILKRIYATLRTRRFGHEMIRTSVAVLVFLLVTTLMTQAQIESDRWFDVYSRKLNVGHVLGERQMRAMGMDGTVDLTRPFAVDPLYDRLFRILPDWTDRRDWLSDFALTLFIATTIFFTILLPTRERISFQRLVVLRRVLWILACLYAFRMATFLVTTVPSPLHNCVPKYVSSDDLNKYLSLLGKMVSGKVTACTDNIYSGHTSLVVVLIFTHFTYSGRWWCKIYALLHGFTIVSLILLTRLHYTVDVLIAGFMASFVFVTYHFVLSFFLDNVLLASELENSINHGEEDSRGAIFRERRLTSRLLNYRLCRIIWWIDGLDLRVGPVKGSGILILAGAEEEVDEEEEPPVQVQMVEAVHV